MTERLTIEALARGATRLNRNAGGIGEIRVLSRPAEPGGWYKLGYAEDFEGDDVVTGFVAYDQTPGWLHWKDDACDEAFVVQEDAEVIGRLLHGT